MLLVGSGGREHALAWRLAQDGAELHAAPGNPGIAPLGTCHPVRAEDHEGLLALALALITALRTRTFPLRAHAWMLWSVTGAIAVTALAHLASVMPWATALIAAGSAALIGTIALVDPPAPVRARLRGWGDGLETLAVVALIPLVLGAAGLYRDLLTPFGGAS